jgi:hypothetical protein
MIEEQSTISPALESTLGRRFSIPFSLLAIPCLFVPSFPKPALSEFEGSLLFRSLAPVLSRSLFTSSLFHFFPRSLAPQSLSPSVPKSLLFTPPPHAQRPHPPSIPTPPYLFCETVKL